MIRIGSGAYLVKIAAVISVLVYILQMLEIGAAVSLLFAFSIMCVATSYMLKCIRVKCIKIADLAMFAIVILSIVRAGIEWSFDYYKPAIIVICCVLCIDLCPECEVNEKDRKQIANLFIIAAIITNILYYFAGYRHNTFGSTKYISLNMSNPNEAGMWLAFFIITLLGSGMIDKTKKKYVMYLSALSLIPILSATGSRGSLIAVCVFAAAVLINKVIRMEKIPVWLIWVIALAPAIIFFFYMKIFIPNYDVFEKIFAFFSAEGKNLDSRFGIWNVVQENFIGCFAFGRYDIYRGNLHNSLLSLYASYGFLFMLISCVKFVSAVNKLNYIVVQWAMAAVWLIGCFEFGFFGGVGGMFMMILVMPAIMKKKSEGIQG